MPGEKTIVILLESPTDAARIVEPLRHFGIESTIVRGPSEFLAALRARTYDAVVIENELKESSGLEVLSTAYDDMFRPSTVLVAKDPAAVIERARLLGISSVLESASDTVTLLDSIRKATAARRQVELLIAGPARRLVERCTDIPPLPQLLVRIATYLESECPLDQLASEIAVDPKVTAELLRLVNSAAMGLSRKVHGVADAVKLLGVRRCVACVTSAIAVHTASTLWREIPDAERSWYNRRSVVIASTAGVFARGLLGASTDVAYVAGLLQDIGILLMGRTLGDSYMKLLKRFREIGQLRLEALEKRELGYTHADVSGALIQLWGLPRAIVHLVLRHHGPDDGLTGPSPELATLRAMRIGEAWANLADGHAGFRMPILRQLFDEAGFAPNERRVREYLAESVKSAATSSQLFCVPVPDTAVLEAMIRKVNKGNIQPAEPNRTARAWDAALPPGTSGKPAVLIVEDERAMVNAIRNILSRVGVDVLHGSTRAEALQHAESALAALVDVKLGAETGVDITKALRHDGFEGPIIIVSGDRTRQTVAECVVAGANDYIAKPFQPDTLLAKLRLHMRLPLEPVVQPST